MLNPTYLETFVAAAQGPSFSEAGRRLGLRQSTVSEHVARLEAAVKRRLFVRDTHSLRLTAHGEALLVHARLILEAHARAETQFRGPALRGRLRFGTSDDLALGPLPGILASFRAVYPEVELNIATGLTADLYAALDGGSLDLMVGKRRPGDERGTTLYRAPLHWLAAGPAAEGPVPLAILAEPSVTRATVLTTLAAAGLRWRIVCSSSSYAGAAAAARAGLGVTALPDFLDVPGLVRRRDLPALPETEYIAVLARGAGRAADALLEAIRNALLT